MSENCNHDCSSCGGSCKDRDPKSMLQAPHEMSSIKNVIAVVSGKGGVGKSLVTSLLASSMQKKGYHSAVIDADITGPSIPKAFGIHEKAYANEMGLIPVKSRGGIDVMSINLLLDNDTDPVLWRGPIIAGAVSQFWTDVIWENVDYMFVDMPPGTGDVPLTVFQSLPLKGIIVVTSPQELVSVIVEKAVKMAEMMNIPVLGIVENMSYFECPDCKSKHSIFGESHIDEIAARHGIASVSKLPIDPAIASACDKGEIEAVDAPWLAELSASLEKICN
ncbi:Mrp/NBP35 family ATP-binding protein [Eisenbergiella massiliensis]|uniref:Mrp/NBP35 family ATP-binding protein n=1 Tax=Eisenbergiella massiliensis TaxID=1720294 RepID=UPI002490D5D0|nr:Mrp/NBP35 family ATP-binding protein [Eisenbergiella massiliensis]